MGRRRRPIHTGRDKHMNKNTAPGEKFAKTRTMLEAFAMGTAAIAAVSPVVLILCYMDRLKVWWFPLLILYFVIFFALEAFLVIPQSASRLHSVLGSYNFYKAFPQELARTLRQYRKYPQPDREKVIASYRERMVTTEADLHNEKLRAHSKRLFLISGAIVTALTLWCVFGLFLSAKNGDPMNISHLIRAGAAFMMALTAFYIFRRTPKHVLSGVTCALLLLGAWSEFWTDYSLPDGKDFQFMLSQSIESLIILGIFMIAAIVLASIADRLQKSVRTHQDHQQFLLDLYEIGVLDEKELEVRFSVETH